MPAAILYHFEGLSPTIGHVMTPTMEQLIEQVRNLSAADRARLVGSILETLDEPDPGVEAAWKAEVERRAAGAESGTRPAVEWSEARSKLGL